MATFKVGQRVRIIGCVQPRDLHWIGTETTVTGCPYNGILGPIYPVDCSPRGVYAFNLAPLTDPKADAFIESIKKMAREPAPAESLGELLRATY